MPRLLWAFLLPAGKDRRGVGLKAFDGAVGKTGDNLGGTHGGESAAPSLNGSHVDIRLWNADAQALAVINRLDGELFRGAKAADALAQSAQAVEIDAGLFKLLVGQVGQNLAQGVHLGVVVNDIGKLGPADRIDVADRAPNGGR